MKNCKDKKFQGAVILSVLLHIILIGAFFFGVPSLFERLPEEKDVLTFEILPISEIANVKTETKVATKKKEAKKSKQVKKQAPKKSTPKQKSKPTSTPKKKIEKKVKNIPAKKKAASPPKKVKEKKKEPQKPQPTPKKKEITKKDEDAIDSILKNLEKDSEGNEVKTSTTSTAEKQQGKKYSRGAEYDEDSPLSITEKMLVKGQIEKNWRPPAGADNLDEVRVVLHMTLEKNGEVKDVVVTKIICPINSSITCKLTAESAIRAVRKASPLENLLPERYDTWKEFNLIFDPSFLNQ